MKMLNKIEKQRWFGFHKQGGTNLNRCKVNDFNWNSHNTLEHEIAKLTKLHELVRAGHKCITECVNNKTGCRNDVYDLSDGIVYEIETTKGRGDRHDGVVGVEVVKLYKEVKKDENKL